MYGNHPSKDHLYDFLLILKRFFVSHGHTVTSSKNLRTNTLNVVIEEFCYDPSFIQKISAFKLKNQGKIVVLLTEFLTREYLNNFSFKSRCLNVVTNFYFGMQSTKRKIKKIPQKTSRRSFMVFEKFLIRILQTIKTGEINIAEDIGEINYLQRRLNGIKCVIPYVDLWMGLYSDQIKGWKSLLGYVKHFNFSRPNFKENSEGTKKYDFYFSGKLTQKRKKVLDNLSRHFKVYYPKSGYVLASKRNTILKQTKFLLCLPRADNWPYSSCTRTWSALENGAIPINLSRYVLTDWEDCLKLPQVDDFTLNALTRIYSDYEKIRDRLKQEIYILV